MSYCCMGVVCFRLLAARAALEAREAAVYRAMAASLVRGEYVERDRLKPRAIFP